MLQREQLAKDDTSQLSPPRLQSDFPVKIPTRVLGELYQGLLSIVPDKAHL